MLPLAAKRHLFCSPILSPTLPPALASSPRFLLSPVLGRQSVTLVHSSARENRCSALGPRVREAGAKSVHAGMRLRASSLRSLDRQAPEKRRVDWLTDFWGPGARGPACRGGTGWTTGVGPRQATGACFYELPFLPPRLPDRSPARLQLRRSTV